MPGRLTDAPDRGLIERLLAAARRPEQAFTVELCVDGAHVGDAATVAAILGAGGVWAARISAEVGTTLSFRLNAPSFALAAAAVLGALDQVAPGASVREVCCG